MDDGPAARSVATVSAAVDDRAAQPAPPRRPTGRQIGAIVLVGLVVLFAALNSQTVEVDWLVATSEVPLFVVIAISALLGVGAGYLTGRRHGRARRQNR